MKFLTNIFFTSLLSLLLLSNISYAQPNVQVLNYSHGKYVGEALNGKANGQGTYTSKSGVIYQGQFISDTFSGSGTMFWTNGDKFVGTWNNDSAVNGTMSFANGSSAQGTVRNAIFYAAQTAVQQPIAQQPSTVPQPATQSKSSSFPVYNYSKDGSCTKDCFTLPQAKRACEKVTGYTNNLKKLLAVSASAEAKPFIEAASIVNFKAFWGGDIGCRGMITALVNYPGMGSKETYFTGAISKFVVTDSNEILAHYLDQKQ